MTQLIIHISPKEVVPSLAERNNHKTPKKKQSHAMRVINLAFFDAEINYGTLAKDICADAGDKYYGHEIVSPFEKKKEQNKENGKYKEFMEKNL